MMMSVVGCCDDGVHHVHEHECVDDREREQKIDAIVNQNPTPQR